MGEVWFGKTGTRYEGVQATIEAVTKRNIQVSYDRIVSENEMQLGGEVMGKQAFLERFDNNRQMTLFD